MLEERVSFSSEPTNKLLLLLEGSRLPSTQAAARTSNIMVVYHVQKEKVKWERGLWAPAEQRGDERRK